MIPEMEPVTVPMTKFSYSVRNLKAGHEVSDIEAPDIVHVIGTKGRPVSVGEQDIVFMDVNAFDVVHSRTILSWGCAE